MTNEEMIEMAKQAMMFSYSPYSNFRVGACLLTKSGKVYTGCNIENASYGGTICAERTAMVKAVSEGETQFVKIAIVGSSAQFTYPCGICRQFMAEFMEPNASIILEDKEQGIHEFLLKELLPGAFTRKDLFDE